MGPSLSRLVFLWLACGFRLGKRREFREAHCPREVDAIVHSTVGCRLPTRLDVRLTPLLQLRLPHRKE